MLTPAVQRFVLDQRLGFVATVRPDGAPNLSPKGTTVVLDDEHLMFADVASPQTVENLHLDPRVEVNVVDPILRKGYRFRGVGEVFHDGPDYERGLTRLRELGSTTARERIRSIVIVRVTEVHPLVSPAYDDGTSESKVVARWRAHFAALHPE